VTSHDRPLSPHLQVYRLALTTVVSGLHRVTGLALSACGLLLVVWLIAAARGPDAYAVVYGLFASLPGRLLLVAALVAFWYHLFAGLRHLAWDLGLGFEKAVAPKTAGVVVALAAIASILTLVLAWRHLA
jgi:succinate dehydrogenase / fumarate reductase cytochrome b subunit